MGSGAQAKSQDNIQKAVNFVSMFQSQMLIEKLGRKHFKKHFRTYLENFLWVKIRFKLNLRSSAQAIAVP